jgi:LPXTG-site transpeptidase (sortase) family protein
MEKRFLLLAALLLLVGFVTRVFAEEPGTPITRAGAIALMVESDPALKQRLQYHIKHPAPMPLFDDLDYSQWYAPYIETAFEAGLVTGNADARFRPSSLMTDEESIVLMNRYYALKHPGTPITTVQPGEDWFTAVINQASQNGLPLPSPIRLGMPVSRTSVFSMMRSSGVTEPEKLTVSYQPVPVVIVQAPAPRPTSAPQQNRPVQIASIRPIATTPRPTAVAPVQAARPAVQQPRPTTVAQTAPANAVAPVKRGFSISLPTLGITDLVISHPSSPTTKDGLLAPLKYGVGHLFSYPGGGGTILVYGHSSSYAWDVSKYTKIFRQINKLAVGDKVTVNYNGKAYIYQVTYKQSVPANDLSAYKGGRGEELILYTCWPPDSIKERYLVHASPVSEVAAR